MLVLGPTEVYQNRYRTKPQWDEDATNSATVVSAYDAGSLMEAADSQSRLRTPGNQRV
jgi:hypothetical protein